MNEQDKKRGRQFLASSFSKGIPNERKQDYARAWKGSKSKALKERTKSKKESMTRSTPRTNRIANI